MTRAWGRYVTGFVALACQVSGGSCIPAFAQDGPHANLCFDAMSVGNYYSGGSYTVYLLNRCDQDINVIYRGVSRKLTIRAGTKVIMPDDFPNGYDVCYAPYLPEDGKRCDFPEAAASPAANAPEDAGSGQGGNLSGSLGWGRPEEAWEVTEPGYNEPVTDEGLAASEAWAATAPRAGECPEEVGSDTALGNLSRQLDGGNVSGCVIATKKPGMPGDYFHNICADTDVTIRWIDNNYCHEESACSEDIMAGQYGMQKNFMGYYEFHACAYPDYLAIDGGRCVKWAKPLGSSSGDSCS